MKMLLNLEENINFLFWVSIDNLNKYVKNVLKNWNSSENLSS